MLKTSFAENNPRGRVLKKSRSCGYPLLALPAAVEAAKRLFDGLGEGPHSRQTAARGLGYSSFSGAASGKIGALVHFGLLSRSGGMYLVTPLAKEVFSYPDEASLAAIGRAAAKPVLYNKLAARFLNKSLPEKLEEILAADYGITQKAAPAAAQNFIQTMEFAGMINDGKLISLDLYDPKADNEVPDPAKITAVPLPVVNVKLVSGIEIRFPQDLAYRLAMGEFAPLIKDLDRQAGGV